MKENFLNLIEAFRTDEDVLKMITYNMAAFSEYVASVYILETNIPIIRMRYEGQDARDRIQKLDRKRRICHEAAINAVRQLNRWAKLKKVEPIYSGDENDRNQIANFCIEIVKEFFEDGNPRPKATLEELKDYAEN